jgi:hypothetical protein
MHLWYLTSRPWLWFVGRGLLLLSQRQTINGFEVYDATSGGIDAPLARIHEALELIRARTPRRYGRVRRDVRRLVIIAAGGAEYWPQVDGMALTRDELTSQSIEEVAFTIVHEATHARFWKMGIPYAHTCRERIERLCVREEVAFAQTLPDADWWVAEVQRPLATPWWTDDAIRERRSSAWRELKKPPSGKVGE